MKTTCIMCPLGCELNIETGKSGISVTGNTCVRGETYAKAEVVNPMRAVSTLIKLEGGGVIPVKTTDLVPKSMIPKILKAVSKITLKTKPKFGSVIIKDILGTKTDIIAIGL